MFNVDDNLLQQIGYNVAFLTEEEKNRYKKEITEALHRRVAERLATEINQDDLLEFEDVQGNLDRTRRWLAEFHGDYATRDDYRTIRSLFDTEEDAMSFYASALWLRYAVPGYGKIMQQVMDEYVEDLVEMRNQVNQRLGIATQA